MHTSFIPAHQRHWAMFLCGIVVAFVGACTSRTSAISAPIHPTPTLSVPTPTAIPTAFPPFHDWRAAYVSQNGFFHAVSLDGKTDSVGSIYPGFMNGVGLVFSAGASPNGRYIAYLNNQLVVSDLYTKTSPSNATHTGDIYIAPLFWSPDSLRLAIGPDQGSNDPNTIATTHVVVISPLTIPNTPPIPGTKTPVDGPYIYPEGWIDNQTLLMYTNIVQSQNPFTTTAIVEAVDATTGATRVLATFPHGEQSNFVFALAPDGKEVFLYNFQAHDEPFTPIADVIDTTTGAVHPLSSVTALENKEGYWITAAAWRPGTQTLAITIGAVDPDVPTAADFLVDTTTGTYVAIPSKDFVGEWSPDGSTLVLTSDTNGNTTGGGPFTLTAVTFPPSGPPQLTMLTHNSMFFSFLGFIRSA